MEDKELIERLLKGDHAAFKVLVEDTEALVAQIVFKMVDNAEDRRDLVQDIYMNVHRYLKNFKFQCKLSTWIGSIAYNACYNYLKKRKLILPGMLQSEDQQESALEAIADRFVDHFHNQTISEIFRKELGIVLNKGIDTLSPVHSTILSLYHYQELSYQEIAEITNMPEGTVKNYLFRARKKLKEYILLNYKKEDL